MGAATEVVKDGAEAPEDTDITELEKIDATRIDGVHAGANGMPFLVVKGLPSKPKIDDDQDEDDNDETGDSDDDAAKATRDQAATLTKLVNAQTGLTAEQLLKAVGADGQVDEGPDIKGGQQVIAMLAQLIIYEAQELKTGCLDETYDIDLLNQAVCAVKCWVGREQGNLDAGTADEADGFGLDGTVLAGDGIGKALVALRKALEKDARTFTVSERKKHAAAGNALPDGSYPIPDADALRRAAILARSKHGNWKAARRLIARRARELGVTNPLKPAAASKSVAPTATDVDNGTDVLGRDQIDQLVADAVAKATGTSQERMAALEAELAKVKATPIPGGPVASITTSRAGGVDEERSMWAAKAAYYEQMAKTMTSPADADGYRQLAREALQKAKIEV